jgi:hypothetical protein
MAPVASAPTPIAARPIAITRIHVAAGVDRADRYAVARRRGQRRQHDNDKRQRPACACPPGLGPAEHAFDHATVISCPRCPC